MQNGTLECFPFLTLAHLDLQNCVPSVLNTDRLHGSKLVSLWCWYLIYGESCSGLARGLIVSSVTFMMCLISSWWGACAVRVLFQRCSLCDFCCFSLGFFYKWPYREYFSAECCVQTTSYFISIKYRENIKLLSSHMCFAGWMSSFDSLLKILSLQKYRNYSSKSWLLFSGDGFWCCWVFCFLFFPSCCCHHLHLHSERQVFPTHTKLSVAFWKRFLVPPKLKSWCG